jgi:hypothetical protein
MNLFSVLLNTITPNMKGIMANMAQNNHALKSGSPPFRIITRIKRIK